MNNSEAIKKRVEAIDLLKLIAMSMVIFSHVMPHYVNNAQSTIFYNLCWITQMPLFFICSGFTFRYKKFDSGKNLLAFIKKISLRLLYPLLTFLLIKSAVNGENVFENLKSAIFDPSTNLWFLWVLFLAEIVSSLSFFFSREKGKYIFNILLAIIAVIFYALFIITKTSFLGVKLLAYYFPFFLLGIFVQKHFALYNESKKAKVSLIIFFVLSTLASVLSIVFIDNISGFDDSNILLIAARYGLSICACTMFFGAAFLLCKLNFFKLFSKLGKYSLESYFIHVFLINIFVNIIPMFCGPHLFTVLFSLLIIILVFLCVFVLSLIPFGHFTIFGTSLSVYKFENRLFKKVKDNCDGAENRNVSNSLKVVFISNFLNFHQTGLWDEFVKNNVTFTFLATSPISQERLEMGYKVESRNYLKESYKMSNDELKELLLDTDFVIIGSVSDKRIYKYSKLSKNIIFNTEHEFRYRKLKNVFSYFKRILTFYGYYFGKQKFVLCNSYYAGLEFKRYFFKRNNIFNFGYFPLLKISCEKHIENEAIFSGRVIPSKRPDLALDGLKYLHDNFGYTKLLFIGEGKQLDELKTKAKDYPIVFKNFVEHDELLKIMSISEVFLFTSNKAEGWGVVLNEALSQGCIVVASDLAGSSLMLIKDTVNGFLFDGTKQDFEKVLSEISTLDQESKNKISEEAKKTISEVWNCENAASRLYKVLSGIMCNNRIVFDEGPLSIWKKK